jgi:Rrf2 family iron-sulfur cluster assembly transcriptional regulator
MQISTRGRYAVMAMVHLANAGCCVESCCRPVTLAEIAAAEMLSLAYLEQLFGRLRRAGLVASARGPGGGYRLARSECRISIFDIVLAVDENLAATRCEDGVGCQAHAGRAARCRTHDLWAELGSQIHQFLAGITLADVVAGRVAGRAVGLAPVPPVAARVPAE